MLKSKRTQQQAEALTLPKLYVDPLYMVALRSASGRVYLVDRNCALVSRRCRRYLERKEEEILQREEADGGSPCAAVSEPTTHVPYYGIRGNKEDGHRVDTDKASSPAAHGTLAEDDCFVSVPATTLFDVYQKRLTAAADQHQAQPPRNEALRGSGGPQGKRPGGTPAGTAGRTSATPPPVPWPPAFGALEDYEGAADGLTLYPLIDLTDVPDPLLDMALGFMYLKYRSDTDFTEKWQSTTALPSCDDGSNAEQLIAASVILEI